MVFEITAVHVVSVWVAVSLLLLYFVPEQVAKRSRIPNADVPPAVMGCIFWPLAIPFVTLLVTIFFISWAVSPTFRKQK